jgi:apolipoprotein N-acyltransferase
VLLNIKKIKLVIFTLIVIFSILLMAQLLKDVNWTIIEKNIPIKVTVIQGNTPQELKWNADFITKTLNTYQTLTGSHWDSNIIVWPENAIPLPKSYAVDFLQELDNIAKNKQATLITGLPIEADHDSYYNSIIALGNGHGEYYKKYLVPFGEYTPLKNLFTKLNSFLGIPMSSFIKGPSKQNNLNIGEIMLAPFICYEIAYTEALLDFRKKAHILVTISNDSWFGRSIAQSQHLQIARTQSLQTGRYQIISTNDGVSALVNSKGNVIKTIPPFKEGTLTGLVYKTHGLTPWMYVGDDKIMLIFILSFLIMFFYKQITFFYNKIK